MVEGVAEVEIPTTLTGIKGLYLKVSANNSDYSTILAEGVSLFNTSPLPTGFPTGAYVLRTPAMKIGAGGPVAHLSTQILIEFNNTTTSVPVSATLKIRSVGIRRLPKSHGPLATITPAAAQTVCPNNPVLLQANTASGLSYQWTSNGNDLSGKTAASLSATDPGSYTVKVSADGMYGTIRAGGGDNRGLSTRCGNQHRQFTVNGLCRSVFAGNVYGYRNFCRHKCVYRAVVQCRRIVFATNRDWFGCPCNQRHHQHTTACQSFGRNGLPHTGDKQPAGCYRQS
jgi:hypothetical protein